jgi:hypothetical protein
MPSSGYGFVKSYIKENNLKSRTDPVKISLIEEYINLHPHNYILEITPYSSSKVRIRKIPNSLIDCQYIYATLSDSNYCEYIDYVSAYNDLYRQNYDLQLSHSLALAQIHKHAYFTN